jgi:FkbM family methyltransferase
MSRAASRLRREYIEYRDGLEWRAVGLFAKRAPWCVNRLGQRYQPLSLGEYRYMRDGNPEMKESYFAERSLTPGDTVIDVGANHGLFTMEAAKFVGNTGRVGAFEPTPTTRAALERHLQLNNLSNVHVYPQAVGSAPGTAKLRVHFESTGLNTLASKDIEWSGRILVADQVLDVPIITLDDHAQQHGVDTIAMLKVDVEGFELPVIQGASQLLSQRKISKVLVEVSRSTSKNAGIGPGDLVDELAGHGYILRHIHPDGTLGQPVDRNDEFVGDNYAACAPA